MGGIFIAEDVLSSLPIRTYPKLPPFSEISRYT